MIVKHVENNSPSLRIYLQKIGLKRKVEQVEEQKLGSKVDLEKVKVKHVEEQKLSSKVDLRKVKVEHLEKGSTSNIQVEIVNQIFNQRFQNYLNYHWIQKSIIQYVASRSFKRARN